MSNTKIMLIRHGEKHGHGIHDYGVSADGRHKHHELTVRGWQRAALLVTLFAPAPGPLPRSSLIQTPRSIFASDATKDSPSLRAMHTAGPLATALGISVNHDHAEDEEDALAAAVMSAPSPVLIVWHHGNIPRLARSIAGPKLVCPLHWPDDRFDMVWILDHSGTGIWTFSQVPQRLFHDDPSTPF